MEIVFNKTKKILLILILTLVFISLGTTIFAAEKFNLGTTAVVMYQDRQYQLTPNKSNVKYKSSNEWFATVDNNGVITAKRIGIITITGTDQNGETATCKVRVKMKTSLIDRIRGMGLNISSATVYKNRQLVINEYLVTNQIKEWKSSDENIVKIDYKGAHTAKLTAKNAGTAELTVTNAKGKKVTVDIVVKEPETQSTQPQQPTVDVTELTLEKDLILLGKGQETQLKANRTVTWASDNTGIATVDKNTGKVKGVTQGSAKITATDDRGRKVSCKIAVFPLEAEVGVGKTIQFPLTDRYTTWQVTKGGNCISYTGSGIVKGISAGSGELTVQRSDGQRIICKITVPKESFHSVALDMKKKIADADITYVLGTYNFESSRTPFTTGGIDCSAYVSYVLYEYGKRNGINEYKNAFVNSKGCTAMKDWFDSNTSLVTKIGNLSTVASQGKLKAGDILIRNKHVEIYSYTANGDLYVFNCGSAKAVERGYAALGHTDGNRSLYTVYRLVK